MDSLAEAARLIDDTTRVDGMTGLLAALGFAEPPLTLDAISRGRLGLAPATLSACVSVGTGGLRALTIEVSPDSVVRDCITTLAHQLSKRAPHLLWIIVLLQRDGPTVAIATWRNGRTAVRIAAMMTERGRVFDSDAETLCALSAATAESSDVLRHMRWLDILGRDAVTQRFFLSLSNAVDTLATSISADVPAADAREIALLTTSRMLFLSFLETKGWLNSDFGFLANGFAECMSHGGAYQRRVLEPLFFGTLNTRVSERASRARAFGRIPFLNGGLFARTVAERIHRQSRFTDDALGALFGDVLVRYRFTAREDAATWSQAAIDPEMLGKVFESLMESGDRKRGGVYYTPQRFVERVTRLTLRTALERHGLSGSEADSLLHDPDADRRSDPQLLTAVRGLTILDPACGSGAFLVYALDRIARLRVALGDPASPTEVRRSVLTRSIFGVDSSPIAVWLCELRLWLASVIDSDERDCMRVAPLPNLDRQIRVGDSLSGDAFNARASALPVSRQTAALRDRYARSSGRRKVSLGRKLDATERTRALAAIDAAVATAGFERQELLRAARSRDLFDMRTPPGARHRDRLLNLRSSIRALKRKRALLARGDAPSFSYSTHFADVADSGGFDAVIGNPPWVRVHHIPPDDRARYRDQFQTYRASAWIEGARGAQAGRGFAGQVDLAALFLERALDLLAPNGTLGLLLPAKLWRSLAGGGARQLALNRANIIAIEDYAEGPDAFDAAVYPSLLVATRATGGGAQRRAAVSVTVQRRDSLCSWTALPAHLSFDSTDGSPWLLLPPDARASFDLLTRAGVPLFESCLRRPHLGVKTGCNEAFLVRAASTNAGITAIHTNRRSGEIEACSLRPLVRGETLTRWQLASNDERIIWTHGASGQPVCELPPHTHRWLARSRRLLEQRTDSHSERWWSLFRVESAEFTSPRVVWSDFGRVPEAAVLDAGDRTVPLNTCYSVACRQADDALAFAAILNSTVAAAWLSVIAEPARGGYHRYLGWTIARLPIPIDWPRARRILAPVARSARSGSPPSGSELHAIVLDAYELAECALDPLRAWTDARHDD